MQHSISPDGSAMGIGTSESSVPQKRKLTRASTACSACRKLKMKCVGGTETKPCNRCARTGKECVLQERQKKKHSSKKDAEILALKAQLRDMEEKVGEGSQVSPSDGPRILPPPPPPPAPSSGSSSQSSDWFNTVMPRNTSYPSEGSIALPSFNNQNTYSNGSASSNLPSTDPSSSDYKITALSNTLATPSQQVMAQFDVSPSDRIWLETNAPYLPFLKTNQLSSMEAINLFKLFMMNCSLHTVCLDPEWHTLSRVGQASNGFLLACILYLVSAYYDNERPGLQRQLQAEMDLLIGKVITSGEKSIEIIQAFMLLYWWSRPSGHGRDNAWLWSGIALRMATNINLSNPPSDRQEDERDRRNRERTWLMVFLVDRSLSAAVGKQYSIKGDDPLVRNSDTWCSQPAARVWDLGISGLADLLKCASRQTDILNTAMGACTDRTQDMEFDCDTMMRIMNDELVQWRKKWFDRGVFTSPIDLENVNGNFDHTDIHTYAFHFITKQANMRFQYAVLVLNTFGLQYCSINPGNAECKTFCLTHAIQAAQHLLISARDGLGPTLSYAPHTQYTIISFGIISLIKLSSLKSDDPVVADRLIKLVESGITFLERISTSSISTPARCASLLRAVLRRKRANDALNRSERPTFRPGMEEHDLPVRSSRASSPFRHGSNNHQSQNGLTPSQTANHLFSSLNASTSMESNQFSNEAGFQQNQNPSPSSWHYSPGALLADLGLTPTGSSGSGQNESFGVFGNDGSLGWDQMTADEILNDNFWLKLQ